VLSGATPVTVSLANFANAGSAQVWQLTSGNTIARLADVGFSGNSLTASVPAQSITLYVIAGGTPNLPPNAVIQANPTSGVAPLTVNFSGAGSSDPDGSIASYAWNLGGTASGTGVTASAQYTVPGTYIATLTVTDNLGATASSTATITVTADSSIINAPSNLTGSNARGGKVTLRWTDNSSNEEGFSIERAPAGSSSYVQVGQVGVNATSFSQTVAKATYLYRVRAFNTSTGKFSPYSNVVSVRVTK
jgi:PKD repeat protein